MTELGPLAIDGGKPVRTEFLPYARHTIDDNDVAAVVAALKSDWLTTGPLVEKFEEAFSRQVGARHAVAVSSGTAALHAAIHALGVAPGDEVIVPAMTFASTANSVVFEGGTPVFADVSPDTLLVEPGRVADLISPRTRAVIAVDYAGQACEYDELRSILDARGISLVADACHALGGRCNDRPVGSLADLSAFSFHPAKHIATGEGGMVTTSDRDLARRMRIFRNHGITTDHRQRAKAGSWRYDMMELGYNYRLSDIQCALGLRQLQRLEQWVERRRSIARRYIGGLSEVEGIESLMVRPEVHHAYHLFVIKLAAPHLAAKRDDIFSALRAEGIGVNVHFIPVHLHPYYRHRFGTGPGLCPVAEAEYRRILSLPVFASMTDGDVDDVVTAVTKVVSAFVKE